jgi:hypothetical protein
MVMSFTELFDQLTWAECMEDIRSAFRRSVGKYKWKKPILRLGLDESII